MKESNAKASNNIESGDVAPEPVGQALMAAAVGATVLAVTMVLIFLAAVHGRPDSEPVMADSDGRNISERAYGRFIQVDHYAAGTETTVTGSLIFAVKGYMQNTGLRAVRAADLRCYFPMHSSGETHFDLPLVADTRIDDLSDGPLPPSSGRDFSLRLGRIPKDVSAELLRVEVVNVRLESG